MAACWPYLRRQIALLQPRIIVLLGRAAVHGVEEDKALSALRGKPYDFSGIPGGDSPPGLPAAQSAGKAKAWEDLLFARALLRQSGGPRRSARSGGLTAARSEATPRGFIPIRLPIETGRRAADSAGARQGEVDKGSV